MEFTRGNFIQKIAGRWELEDLTIFSSEWEKLYSFYFNLMSGKRMTSSAGDYPWRGGFSTVNFFATLRSRVPPDDRPRLRRFQYASPGWVELEVAIEVAQQIGILVGIVAATTTTGMGAYYTIHSQLTKLKLSQVSAKQKELELAKQYEDFITESLDQMAVYVGKQHAKDIIAMAPNKLAALKMELTLYRRLEPLAKMRQQGLLEE